MTATHNLAGAIAEGERALRENRRPSGIPSSTNYDAALITQHVLYWCGRLPARITNGRGHAYNVVIGPHRYSVRITDYSDHRNGVAGIRAVA